MRFALGPFARSGIEARFGTDLVAGAWTALLHYVRRLDSGRMPVSFPLFCRDEELTDPVTRLDLELDDDASRMLTLEAERQHISMEQLLQHAVLVYLADLDADRADAMLEAGEPPGFAEPR